MTTAEHEIPYRAEVARKILHLLSLVIPVLLLLAGRKTGLTVLIPASILAVCADILRVRSALFARLILRIFGFMMRPVELPPIGGPVRINGATWVLLNASLLTLVFPLHTAVVAFSVVQIADAAAALVGRRFGKKHWGEGRKTVEGSVAFLLTGLVAIGILALMPFVSFWAGVIAVLVATLMEIPDWPVNDNIIVPFSMAAVLFLFEHAAFGSMVALFR